MLVRLLVVLTVLGQPVPRACTCAAEATATPAVAQSAPSAAHTPSRCTHAGKGHRHAQPGDAQSKPVTAAPYHAPHHQHAPNCPACHPAPADAVAPPAGDILFFANLAGASLEPAHVPAAAATPALRVPGEAVPHVPLFITFRVLRN